MKEVFRGGTVISGKKGCEAVKADLLVENGKITGIGSVDAAGAEVIDCTGKYIMPGLINMHAHLFGTGKPSKSLGGGKSQQRLLNFLHTSLGRAVLDKMVADHVKAEFDSGVTTLRSVGDLLNSDLRVRNAVRAGKKPGPRLYCSGPAITVPGGHGAGTFADTAVDPKDFVKLVDQRKKDGVDLIKVTVTGGVMDATRKGSPGEVKMNLEQTKAVCDRAHELGLRVASHTESPEGMKVAIEGGVDTIEHSAGFDEHLQQILRDRKGGVILTFSPALPLAKLPPEMTKLNPMCVYNSGVIMENMRSGGHDAEKAGIPVGLGTDASCPFAAQYNMWREVWFYQKMMGVSKADAIYTATLSNASILGVADITGSLEVGKSADMMILASNPLDDLSAMRDPLQVVLEGRVHTPHQKKIPLIEDALDKMCAEL